MAMRTLFTAAILCLSSAVYAQDEAEIRSLLEARNAEFEEEVIRVSDSVYTAVGYGLSEVSMIVGEDGIVIVDTNLDLASGQAVMDEFRKITNLPVEAIIFTHGHGDHTGGARAFMEEGTQVWAREPFKVEDQTFTQAGLKTILQMRGIRQFGIMVPEKGIGHVGVTARYFPAPATQPPEPVHPTHSFAGAATKLKIAGLELELVAASGETVDQLFVWFEDERVLFAGDNFYKSWPNLYAIRGTAYRDVSAWVSSLAAMLEKRPHGLVGGHTRPILGQANVTQTLTNYRDAVKYVFDKTVEGIELGLTPDELVAHVKLPERFNDLDYLRPYYGHPDWGVRSIFNGYLGWFDGNPANLFPISPDEEAARMVQLAGGREAIETAIEEASEAGEVQWALQLSDYLLALTPDDADLLLARAELLDARAQQVLNVTARNYYRSVAFELRQKANSAQQSMPDQ